ADLAGLTGRIGERRWRKEMVDGPAERDRDDHQHDHGNRGFGPALRENFAKQMVGPVSGLQSNEGFLHRRTMVTSETLPRRSQRETPEPLSRTRYFFRSARF